MPLSLTLKRVLCAADPSLLLLFLYLIGNLLAGDLTIWMYPLQDSDWEDHHARGGVIRHY